MPLMNENRVKPVNAGNWVYVLVQDPDADAQILGQQDTKSQVAYVPVFKDKDSALALAPHLAKPLGHRYEVQAILYEDLAFYAEENGFWMFFIDSQGNVVDRKAP